MTTRRFTPQRSIALAHDWLVTPRGGEAVLEAIAAAATTVGEVGPLLTMFDGGLSVGPNVDRVQRIPSVLESLPCALAARRWLLPAYGMAVNDLAAKLHARHARHPIDLLVSSSSAAILGLATPPGVPHLCYIHAPARYLRNLSHDYARSSLPIRIALELFGGKLQDADREFARGVNEFVANSMHTANEVKSAYGRDATVIHPPVRTDFFTPSYSGRDDFWLVVGALEPYKRVELAIEAARIADRRLVIVGRGSCLQQLRSAAHRKVTFITDATDDMVRALFRRARVLLHSQVEDFGIAAVEAQACGLPVAAYAAGGALETVLDGVSGILCTHQNASELARAALESPLPDDPRIRASAIRFEPAVFQSRFIEVLRRLVG